MSNIDEMLQTWKDGIKEEGNEEENYKSNLLHEEWAPKWKRFQPPMWKMFRWAYNIKRTLFTGVYPVSIPVSTSGERINANADGSFELEFKCNNYESPSLISHGVRYKNPMITEKANNLLQTKMGGTKMEWSTEIKSAIDTMFSHNEIIALWYESKTDDRGYRLIYRGEAWATPDEYLCLEMIKFFGCIPEHIYEADVINILVSVDEDNLQIGLPKKQHSNEGCSDSEDHRKSTMIILKETENDMEGNTNVKISK